MSFGSDDDPFEDVREESGQAMKRLFLEYGSDNKKAFATGVLASIFARVLDLVPMLMLGYAIDTILNQDGTFFGFLPASVQPATRQGELVVAAVVIAGAFLVGAGFHWLRNWGWNSFSQHIQHAVRTDTYDKMQRLNMDFFASKQTGEMMSILSNDVNRLERFLNDGMNSAFRLSVMVLAVAVVLFTINWKLAIITMLPVPVIAWFTYRFVKNIQPEYQDVRSSVGQMNSRLENNLGGIQVIKTSNTEDFEGERVEDVSQGYFDANWGAIRIRIRFFPALRIISGVGFVLTFFVGGYWAVFGGPFGLAGSLSIGDFVIFIQLSQQFIWPMAQFGQIINMYQRARASSERIFGLMDQPSRIVEDPNAQELDVEDGKVVYDDVTFGYDDEAIIEDVSFEVPGGDTLALVGPTGAGKSTVLKLLLRMYDPDEGDIRIDGQDIRNVTLPSLRQAVGYVSQDTFLFYGTVEDNIRYGTFDAEKEDIVEAAKAAEAHEFITNLPDGYDTMVGERGVKLSGGQRQRIDIARAILKDPDILILDEATSDVDTETEMLIQRSLDELTENRTTFSIAHRLSTIKDADQIVVLEDGRIVEHGSHEALLAEDGLYANLWGVQAGEIDELPEEFIERATERTSQVDVDDYDADDEETTPTQD
ncbi:ABC transporter ATP-binding protein [Halocalculus aciditolerans]|uniref:Multidrug ABC transporter ATP-binding protein n=1 Tax=Halocalculus aciditolerans TaxID=1383812 RepID=A0A830F6U6_9EURY|nr:ABC transporter ATP-binding protein [Halocalculus aciditolerans]GGL69225.1 multidrug ABC transporter ATP-binding protein [Halocalculus aciditolerans]